MWLAALMACGGGPDSDPACEQGCGVFWTGEAWTDCGTCRTDAELVIALGPVDEAIDRYANESSMHDVLELDVAGIRSYAKQGLEDEPDADRALITALNRVVQGHRNGHAVVFPFGPAQCESLGGVTPGRNGYGACLEPTEGGFLVHQGSESLGLELGDRIVEVNTLAGEALIDWIADGPLCAGGAGHPAARHSLAARGLLGTIREGDRLGVEGVDGFREIVVGAPEELAFCFDEEPWISGEQRSDGVAVIRIAQFVLDRDDPDFIEVLDIESYQASVAIMLDQAEAVFDDVTPGATGLVWDARGNGGGFSDVGFGLVAGMPGAIPGTVAECNRRVGDSDPAEYEPVGRDYEIPDNERFAFEGPVAGLFDTRSFSAADYFALALAEHTDVPLFGRTTAGAFGSTSPGLELEGTPFGLGMDQKLCVDPDGVPLETRGVEPDHWVEATAEDVAAGRDTVLEAAAAWIVE